MALTLALSTVILLSLICLLPFALMWQGLPQRRAQAAAARRAAAPAPMAGQKVDATVDCA